MNLKEMLERRKAIYETEVGNAKSNEELDVLQTELRKLDLMIAEEERKAKADEGQSERTAAVNGEIPGVVQTNVQSQEQRKSVDEEEMEYRKAFQQFVTKGTPIPVELRDDAVSTTTDVAAAIPVTVVNRIIEKLETIGNILPLVNKTSYPAGMNIPQSKLKPAAVWVAEGAGSDKQKHNL
ncbi:MAG TPA: phage major capsid protein, partial [Clostridiales bacterium]|nr:phage major capsid protein [Clostridiales bacterium]